MVDTQLLKKLRDITKAPFKDCKDAIEKCGDDLEAAKEYLREKWALVAAKKADRETNEWIVVVNSINWKNAWVKLACETDFVAKSSEFRELAGLLVEKISSLFDSIASINDVSEEILSSELNTLVQEYVWKIWENIRIVDLFVDSWNCYVYSHPWDKVVAVVYFNSDDSSSEDVAKELALQIAAMNPDYKSSNDVPSSIISELRERFTEEMADSWKPADIVDKIIDWKISKYLADIVLLEQSYIRDDSKRIKDIIPWNFDFVSFRRYAI